MIHNVRDAELRTSRPTRHTRPWPISFPSMPWKPQRCPITDIPLAAHTIARVMCESYPLISFVYDNDRPPLMEIPCGKPELLTISLYRSQINGHVLTVDDGDQKCVGVAVWTGPRRQSFLGKVAALCVLPILYLWLVVNMLYYILRGFKMNLAVNCLLT